MAPSGVVLLALALALVGAALALRGFAYPRPRPPGPGGGPWRHLGRMEVAFVEAAADTLFPPGGEIPPSGSEAGVAAFLDRYLDAVPAGVRRLMRLLLVLVEHGTLLFPAPGWNGFRRFSALSEAQRVAALDGWRRSRLFPRRLVFTSLRALLAMGYLADPRVLRALDLAPRDIEPVVTEVDLLYPPVGAGREAIPWTEADLDRGGHRPPLGPDTPLHPDYRDPTPAAGGGRA